MDSLLTPVSTTRRGNAPRLPQEAPSSPRTARTSPQLASARSAAPKSAQEALDLLQHQPGYDSLITTLHALKQGHFEDGSLNLSRPSPVGAQIVHVLVTEIAPHYWTLLQEDLNNQTAGARSPGGSAPPTILRLFLDCLANLSGINSILLRLRAITQEAKAGEKAVKRPDLVANLGITLALLEALLEGTGLIHSLWAAATTAPAEDGPAKRRALAQELAALFGSGRVVSYAGEALQVMKLAGVENKGGGSHWIADGAEYTRWFVQNITRWASCHTSRDDARLCSDLLARSMRLGYTDVVVTTTFEDLLLAAPTNLTSFSTLVDGLPSLDQRRFIPAFLKHLSDKYLNTLGSCESSESQAIIAGAARAIHICVGTNDIRLGHLVSWLTSASGAGLGDGIGIRRAVLAVVAQSRDNVIVVLEKSIAQFGDQLYVKHAPMLQQETHAQVLLLSAGYVKRISAIKLTMLMRSAVWLNAVSNRLAATQERARFLGVVVGEALSTLVDKSDKRLDFHMEETNQDEGRWYKELVNVADQPGGLDVLAPSVSVTEKTRVSGRAPEKQSISSQAATVRPSRPPPKGFVIEEVDDDESEGDDLTPYAKPDSDAEDSDDDATLVRRDKPKAPVYIRDLIRYLRDTDDFDHQKLALTTAPDLIRRKANFGSEVKDHSDELASLLVGLQDRFEIDNFFQLRLQGMIALVVAQPECMGQWFAKTFYDGDYSVSQRTSILAVLGIGARELAGFEESEYIGTSAFPSKTLPERMKRLYVDSPGASGQLSSSESLKPLPPNALDTVARSLTKQLLGPIAAEAADAVTGPDVLKISTFAARLKQQQSGPSSVRRKVASRPRIRAIPNTTAQLLFTSFFSPLVARFQAALRSSARTRGALVFQQPHLLATYLRTLGIVAHAAGPGTLALPTMTAELWGVLLRARTAGAGDMGVVRAILFSLLALLDVNEDRMKDICAEMGSQVVETMEWVSDVFDRTRGDDGGRGEENEVKMLSAAVLIRLREGVERYKALLMGDMIGY